MKRSLASILVAVSASAAGILYAACTNALESRVLVRIDRTTGAGTEIGPLGLPPAR